MITIIYLNIIFQKFIEKPREFIQFYRIIQESGVIECFPSCPGFRYRVDIISVDSFFELIPA